MRRRFHFVFVALLAAAIMGLVIAVVRKAVDTMDPVWVGLCIALLTVVIGGALLADRQDRETLRLLERLGRREDR